MSEPSYVEDAKWIAETLKRIEYDSGIHGERVLTEVKEGNEKVLAKIDALVEANQKDHQDFHARLSVLEENKSLRYSALVAGGGTLGVLLSWIGKKVGL